MNKTILAVDDSFSIRKMLGVILGQQGYRVIEASDGSDGLERLAGSHVDLIITDLLMPNLDGVGLIREVRRDPSHRFTPIIMLTTEHQAAMQQAGKEAGASAWLTKPFKPHDLLKLIQKTLR